MTQLNQELIKKALALTGKTMEDMIIYHHDENSGHWDEFSQEYFFTFLLSPEFIEKYRIKSLPPKWYARSFGEAIYEYQSGNVEPIETLLSKI